MARRTAEMFAEGSFVNLGTGMPTLVSNYITGRDITLHGENGILGYGRMVHGDEVDHDVFNASGQFVEAMPGVSYFDSVTSFEMARGGRLDAVVLGAYQVDEAGNLANFSLGDPRLGGIGGAMDLVAGKQQLIIMMEHRDSQGRAKLVQKAQYPLTGVSCVDVVVTDLAILRRIDGRFVVEQIAEGFTFDEIQALTEFELQVPTGVK
jgi:3-oxoacid CoA-transferase